MLIISTRDMREQKCTGEIEAHSDPVTSVDFDSTGLNFVSSSYDGVFRIFDLRSLKCLKEAYAPGAPPM